MSMRNADIAAIEARLEKILDRVDGWLKYAETKNAVLLAIGGTAVGTIAQTATRDDVSHRLFVGFMIAEAFMIPGVVIAVLSFFPQTNAAKLLTSRPRTTSENDNLYFHGHLGDYRADELTSRIALLYVGLPDYDATLYRGPLDLAAQVIINSRITESKLRLFALSAALFVTGIAVAVIALFVAVVTK